MTTVTFDGPNKLIKGLAGITEHDVQIDWYSDWKEWMRIGDNAKYLQAMRSIGGDPINPTLTAGDTYFLTNGWKFEPFAEDTNIVVTGNVYVDDIATHGTNRWVQPVGSFQIGVEFNVSNLVDSSIAESPELQFASFDGGVHVDVLSGLSGTPYPTGNAENPVNNIPNARTIAISRGFTKIFIKGNITLDTGDNVSNLILIGQTSAKTLITVNTGADMQGVHIQQAQVTGIFDVEAAFSNFCHLIDLTTVQAQIHDCILEGIITLAGTGQTSIYNCSDGIVTNAPPPSINVGSGRDFALRNYTGDILITNKTGTDNIEINILSGGNITFDSNCTAGTSRVTGGGHVIDNSVGMTLVDNTTHSVLRKILGISGSNQKLTPLTYDSESPANMLTATLETYTDNTLVTVLETYNITATYVTGTNKLASYQMVLA